MKNAKVWHKLIDRKLIDKIVKKIVSELNFNFLQWEPIVSLGQFGINKYSNYQF